MSKKLGRDISTSCMMHAALAPGPTLGAVDPAVIPASTGTDGTDQGAGLSAGHWERRFSCTTDHYVYETPQKPTAMYMYELGSCI